MDSLGQQPKERRSWVLCHSNSNKLLLPASLSISLLSKNSQAFMSSLLKNNGGFENPQNGEYMLLAE